MRKYAIWLVLLLVLAACDDEQPPTQIYIVLSPTTSVDGTETTPEATANPTTDITVTAPASVTRVTVPPTTETTSGVAATATTAPTSVPATPAPAIFPTNTTAQVQAAEQVFEHGRMFWIRHTRQVWVMVANPNDANTGDWFCFNDSYVEGEPEIDPSLIPPTPFYQPRRGFGKLWRTYPEFKEGLGWATTPEFELTSQYTYIPGGYVQNDTYFPGPGEHRLTTLYNETVSFYEEEVRGDCQGGTWRLASAS